MKKYRYISVMGDMGSGKTTVARLIAGELGFSLLEENFRENAFLSRFYSDMERWAFDSQTFFLMEKVTQMLGIQAQLREQTVVQDTPIQQDVYSYAKALHTLGFMDEPQWQLYQKIYTSFEPYFPKPDCIVYLKTSIDEILRRIGSRGRVYEKKIPESYIRLLDRLNDAWLASNTTIPVLTIRTDGLNIVTSSVAKRRMITTVSEYISNAQKA